MISDRVFSETEWPGRLTRSQSGNTQSASGQDASDDTSTESDRPTLLSDEERTAVRERLDRAVAAVDRLEAEASRELDESASVEIGDLPETQSAVRMLAGTHPRYGSEIPEPDESEKLPDDEISGPMVRRAYQIMENPGRNGYGVDMREIVLGDEGEIQPFNPITAPDEATGQTDPGRRDSRSLPSAFEESTRERKLSMFKELAYAAGGYLLKFIEKVIRRIANRIKGMFSVGIPGGPTINLSKPITAGLNWLADGIEQLAEDLLEKALGNDPASRHRVDPSDPPRGGNVGGPTSGPETDEVSNPNAYSEVLDEEPEAAGAGARSAGPEFLQAAQQVLQATTAEARRRDDPRLARALDLYDRARTLRRDVNTHDEIAVGWGAPKSEEYESTNAELPTQETESTAVANDDPTQFQC